MHMIDALISPEVGGAMAVAAASVGGYSIKKISDSLEERKSFIPLIGISAAFIFAAQMINFTIPGTGSSGHIGGGLLLAILLGPHAAFLALSVILIIQSLFFADGGILALGANIINMGFFTCFIAYPFIYKPISTRFKSGAVIIGATISAAVIGLQLGAFSVVLETLLSGKTELPFKTFLLLMQPIHLAIGIVEGLATAALVLYVRKNAPEILVEDMQHKTSGLKKIITVIALLTLFSGGFFSWFASSYPDGLEWSLEKTTGTTKGLDTPSGGIHGILQSFQEATAFLPEYGFKDSDAFSGSVTVQAGTTISGLTGSLLTLVIISTVIVFIIIFKHRKKRQT